MKSIIAWTVRNTPAMNVLVIAIMVIGWISFSSMRREVFPEFDLEMALVTVVYPGATPEEVEGLPPSLLEQLAQAARQAASACPGAKPPVPSRPFCSRTLRPSIHPASPSTACTRPD